MLVGGPFWTMKASYSMLNNKLRYSVVRIEQMTLTPEAEKEMNSRKMRRG